MTDRASQTGGSTAARPPRLTYVTTEGSTLRYLARGQLAYLRRAGFEVSVVSDPDPDLAEAAAREGVAAVGVPMARAISPLRDLVSLARLVRILRRVGPDIVNASTPKAGVLGSLAARLTGVGCRIYTLRGLRLETEVGLKRMALGVAERLAAAAASRVVCVGPSLRRRVIELGLSPADKAEVLGGGSSNGVDTARYRPAEPWDQEGERLRRRLGIPAGAPILGFVGRLSRDKGLEDVAEVFLDLVLERHPEARLILLGRVDRVDSVDPGWLALLSEHPQVVRLGFEDDIAPHYRLMDLLVFPSRREGFPNAPLEAAASGVPVAGYAVTGTVDAVEDGVTGSLVPPGDRAALGRAVLEYLGDGALRRQHGQAGRRRAERQFRQELVWSAWEQTYRQLLESCRANRDGA